jgi:hypothetical protein
MASCPEAFFLKEKSFTWNRQPESAEKPIATQSTHFSGSQSSKKLGSNGSCARTKLAPSSRKTRLAPSSSAIRAFIRDSSFKTRRCMICSASSGHDCTGWLIPDTGNEKTVSSMALEMRSVRGSASCVIAQET